MPSVARLDHTHIRTCHQHARAWIRPSPRPQCIAALRELVAHRFDLSGMPTAVEIRRTNSQVIRRFKAQPTGPSFVALRVDLHGALLNALGDEVVVCGSEVVSLADYATGLRLMFKDGTTDTATVVIGADGVSSEIRRTLHPNEAHLDQADSVPSVAWPTVSAIYLTISLQSVT